MKNPTDAYVYYEDNIDNPLHGFKRNNDNLMWRYWAAKEMADEIFDWYALSNYPFTLDEFTYRLYQAMSDGYPNPRTSYNYLIQLLKKEWFR